jgi:hypothetical protein
LLDKIIEGSVSGAVPRTNGSGSGVPKNRRTWSGSATLPISPLKILLRLSLFSDESVDGFSPQKRTSSTSKHDSLLICGTFLPYLDPATQTNAVPDPDPEPWLKILRPSLFSDESVDGGNPVDGTASTSGSCGDGARAARTEPREEEGEKMEEGTENLSNSKDEDEVHTVLQLLNNFCSIAL